MNNMEDQTEMGQSKDNSVSSIHNLRRRAPWSVLWDLGITMSKLSPLRVFPCATQMIPALSWQVCPINHAGKPHIEGGIHSNITLLSTHAPGVGLCEPNMSAHMFTIHWMLPSPRPALESSLACGLSCASALRLSLTLFHCLVLTTVSVHTDFNVHFLYWQYWYSKSNSRLSWRFFSSMRSEIGTTYVHRCSVLVWRSERPFREIASFLE